MSAVFKLSPVPLIEARSVAAELVNLLGGEMRLHNQGGETRPGYRVHVRRGFMKGVRLERLNDTTVGAFAPSVLPLTDYMPVDQFVAWCRRYIEQQLAERKSTV